MKHSLLLAIAGLAAAGCSASPTSHDDVIVHWTFSRNVVGGSPVSYTCAQAGVDDVFIEFSDGYSVPLPCSPGGVEGVTAGPFAPGLYTVRVRGYRNNLPGVVLYDGTADFTKVAGADAVVDVQVVGIPDDFDIYANFVNAAGTATIGTYCAAPSVAIDSLAYTLVDHLGTEVAGGTMDCGTSVVQAGVSFRLAGTGGVDLDDYAIRIQGFQTGIADPIFDTATKALVPSYPNCTAQTFPHFGSDIGGSAWDTSVFDVSSNLTLCP